MSTVPYKLSIQGSIKLNVKTIGQSVPVSFSLVNNANVFSLDPTSGFVTSMSVRHYFDSLATATITVKFMRSQEFGQDFISLYMNSESAEISLSISLVGVGTDKKVKVLSSKKFEFAIVGVKALFDFNHVVVTLQCVPLYIRFSPKNRDADISITEEERENFQNDIWKLKPIPEVVQGVFGPVPEPVSGEMRALEAFRRLFARRGIRLEIVNFESLKNITGNILKASSLHGNVYDLFVQYISNNFAYVDETGQPSIPPHVVFYVEKIVVKPFIRTLSLGTGKKIILVFGISEKEDFMNHILEITAETQQFAPFFHFLTGIRDFKINERGQVEQNTLESKNGNVIPMTGTLFSGVSSNAMYHIYRNVLLLLQNNFNVTIVGQDINVGDIVVIQSKIKTSLLGSNQFASDDPLLNNREFLVLGVEHSIDEQGWRTKLRLILLETVDVSKLKQTKLFKPAEATK